MKLLLHHYVFTRTVNIERIQLREILLDLAYSSLESLVDCLTKSFVILVDEEVLCYSNRIGFHVASEVELSESLLCLYLTELEGHKSLKSSVIVVTIALGERHLIVEQLCLEIPLKLTWVFLKLPSVLVNKVSILLFLKFDHVQLLPERVIF